MITSVMIISYPALFTPKPNPSGALKFSCSLLIDKDDKKGVQELFDAVEKAKIKGKESLWNNKIPNFRYEPIRDGDKELANGDKTDKVYENKYFVNCSSDTAPGVVIATPEGPKPLMDPDQLFAGCFVRADINPFPFKNSGNAGVGWGLNNILLLKEGPRLDGRMRATDAFADYTPIPEEDGDPNEGDLA